jgi:hypothetical protein
MIVDENDRGRSFRDRLPKHFSRMNERRIEEAASYGDVALEPVLRIEDGDVKLLHRKILQTLRKDLEHIARPAHGCSFLSLLNRHAPAQLERGMDTNRTSRSYTAHTGESGHRLSGEQPERAAAAGENVLSYSECRSTLGAATK